LTKRRFSGTKEKPIREKKFKNLLKLPLYVKPAHGRRRGAKKSHPGNHLDRLAREPLLPSS
jgi:hypothetical protein